MTSLFTTSLLVYSLLTTPYITQTDPVNAIRIYESASEDLSEIREQRQERVDSLNEVRREVRIENREELREKIRELNDERLKTKLLEMSERFEKINQRWSEHWTNVLLRLTQILDKVESKAISLEEEGADTTQIVMLIETARESIESAQTAVNTLSENEYLFEVDDEASIGENVREAISVFKGDMETTKQVVMDAKIAVKNAFAELRQINSEDDE